MSVLWLPIRVVEKNMVKAWRCDCCGILAPPEEKRWSEKTLDPEGTMHCCPDGDCRRWLREMDGDDAPMKTIK